MYEMTPEPEPDPQEWIELIDELVDSGDYLWAEQTLLDIGETIEITGRVSPGQIQAIQNIQYAKFE